MTTKPVFIFLYLYLVLRKQNYKTLLPMTNEIGGYQSRRMPGHIREFNRLEPHSSHDLVFKIWRNNKTEATLRVFCLWLWVTRNQISMGTTGILISKNIKFKILPSTNASLSGFTGFFALKTNQKITCVDFRGEITTKVCRNRERHHLILWHLSSAFKTTTVF